MLLGATFCYGLGNAWSRRRLTGTGLSTVALPAIQLAVGALVILPFAVTTPLVGPVAPAPALALLALGLGGTGLAYVLFWRVLAVAGATVTASVTYVIPLVSTTLGVLVLHEGLHWYEPVGGAVVLARGRADAVGRRAASSGRRRRAAAAAADGRIGLTRSGDDDRHPGAAGARRRAPRARPAPRRGRSSGRPAGTGRARRTRSARASPGTRGPPCRGCRRARAPTRSRGPSAAAARRRRRAGGRPGRAGRVGAATGSTRSRWRGCPARRARRRHPRRSPRGPARRRRRCRRGPRRRPSRAPRPGRPATTSTATTRAPAATATITADSPTPPQPCTATQSPARDPPVHGDGAVGGREPAAQTRGGDRGHAVGEADQVHVGVVEGDELRERAVVGEARLALALAHLLLPGEAGGAARRRRTRRAP